MAFLQYITTLEGGDTLVTKDVDDATAVVTRKFTDDGLLMVSFPRYSRGSRSLEISTPGKSKPLI